MNLPEIVTELPLYRLRLHHPDWHRDAFSKWQRSGDFSRALDKAKELGITATVESFRNNDDEEGFRV